MEQVDRGQYLERPLRPLAVFFRLCAQMNLALFGPWTRAGSMQIDHNDLFYSKNKRTRVFQSPFHVRHFEVDRQSPMIGRKFDLSRYRDFVLRSVHAEDAVNLHRGSPG